MGKLGQEVGALKGGTGIPLRTMSPVFILYFKFLRCLKIYEIATTAFSSKILMYSLKPSPSHPLNSQNRLSMTKIFCCCTLLNDPTKFWKWFQNKSFQILQVSKISCKYKTLLREQFSVDFWDSRIFGKYTV